MEKTLKISELLKSAGHLSALGAKSKRRSRVLEEVRAVLPSNLAQKVVSAGIDEGRLTIGVVGSVWASRLRYVSEATRMNLSEKLGMRLVTVRIRVLPASEI